MYLATLTISAILVVAASIQLIFALWFLRHYARRQVIRWIPSSESSDLMATQVSDGKPVAVPSNGSDRAELPLTEAPLVAVLLAVRGCDPTLDVCLQRVLSQSYPNYQVHAIVDSELDPVWKRLGWLQQRHDGEHRMQIHVLPHPPAECSLKCNSLQFGLQQLSDEVAYVVLVDADVATHPTWIAELIGPLASDPKIGLVSGAQWFEPELGCNWGSLVRSTWNGGALVPTVVFQNPWAGSLAMRLSDARRGEVGKVWSRSVVDDGPLPAVFDRLGLQRHFGPSLMMVNREQCTLGYACRWIARMLFWSRLYEPTFFLSVVHSMFSTTMMVGLFGLFFASIGLGEGRLALISGSSLILSGVMSVAAYAAIRQSAVISRRHLGQRLPRLTIGRWGSLLLAVPLTQLIYLVASLQSLVMSRIRWRDIEYEVKSKDNVRVLRYQAWSAQTDQQDLSI